MKVSDWGLRAASLERRTQMDFSKYSTKAVDETVAIKSLRTRLRQLFRAVGPLPESYEIGYGVAIPDPDHPSETVRCVGPVVFLEISGEKLVFEPGEVRQVALDVSLGLMVTELKFGSDSVKGEPRFQMLQHVLTAMLECADHAEAKFGGNEKAGHA
jgi:hypothetical protein